MSKSKAPALTRDQIRRADSIAIEQFGIPGIVLMENAGRNAATVIRERLLPRKRGRVAIVCGGGNNGGDGFVIARHLANARVAVRLFLATEPSKLAGDAKTNYAIAAAMKLPISPVCDAKTIQSAARQWHKCDVIVDALLGTGFAGAVREPMASVIGAINDARGFGEAKPNVVAIDLPSGLDADTGKPSNATVRADLTITMLARKVGFAAKGARQWTGSVVVADIGAPPIVLALVQGEGRNG
jgi:NAD(P)H-hydrate epimerase